MVKVWSDPDLFNVERRLEVTDVKTLEEKFALALQEQLAQAQQVPGCAQPKLQHDVQKYGAVATAKEYARKQRLSDGFEALAQAGQLALSMEALVVAEQFGTLFSDEEVNHCFQALCGAGYYLWHR